MVFNWLEAPLVYDKMMFSREAFQLLKPFACLLSSYRDRPASPPLPTVYDLDGRSKPVAAVSQTAHLSEKGKLYNKESVVLPLQKGKNQLVIKLYNRFEKKICFSIKPEEEYKVYKQEMGTFPLEPGISQQKYKHLF